MLILLSPASSGADQECQDQGENEAEYKDCSTQEFC
jgi:hypothetical protein